MSESDDFEIEGFRDEIKRLRERLAKFDALYDAASGMSRGVDWNKGTHAKAYRSKLVAAVAALKEKQL